MLQAGLLSFLFFFFKQKTAYEMRISDWSSDVCSSDLATGGGAAGPLLPLPLARRRLKEADRSRPIYSRSRTTGTWSEGRSQVLVSRTTRRDRRLPCSGGVASQWSSRQP